MPPKSREIFHYIIGYKRNHDGLSPSFRDIRASCGVASTSTVRYHIDILVREGLIEKVRRGIMVVGGRWRGPGE